MRIVRGVLVGALCLVAGCSRASDRGEPVEPAAPVAAAATSDAAVAVVSDSGAQPGVADEPPEVAEPNETPLKERWVEVPGLRDAVAIASTGEKICALRRAGTVVCWSAMLSDDEQMNLAPKVLPGIRKAVAIAGANGLCAISRAGDIACADPATAGGKPTKIAGIKNALALDVNEEQACVLTRGGAVSCWNPEEAGSKPTAITGLPPLISIGLDGMQSCGLDRSRQIWCWRQPGDPGEPLEVAMRRCEHGVSYYPDYHASKTCTEAKPAPVRDVQDLIVYDYGEPGHLFYARIGGTGYFGWYDKSVSDPRMMSKTPHKGARVGRYMERFPLPEGTQRLVGGPRIPCAVTAAGVTYCWLDPFGEMPRRTTMPTPTAVTRNDMVICALTAAGRVSCASPEP